MFTPWKHQERAVDTLTADLLRGTATVLGVIPTGGGKTWVYEQLARWALGRGGRPLILTNRKLLIDQLSRTFREAKLDFGVRAAGYPDEREKPFQISSIPTENARVFGREDRLGGWQLHDATLVLVDEPHLQTGDTFRELRRRYLDAGAQVAALTATPQGLGDLYESLHVLATKAELRKCGALVPALHYGPDEPHPDRTGRLHLETGMRNLVGLELAEALLKRSVEPSHVWGRVFDHWKRLNPDGRPTILFAPGVPESLWFAKEFRRRGVKAAHICGDRVWIDGEGQPTSKDARDELRGRSKAGEVAVICNRFVMREGVDFPWLYHAIFATVFGGLSTYLQAGGRMLRAFPGKAHALIQDHGGNWWRHGSLNADRDWEIDDTDPILAALRADLLRTPGGPPEPRRCQRCQLILAGTDCPCGWRADPARREDRTRMVVQTDGTLVELAGPAFKPRREVQRPDTQKLWTKCYFQARGSKRGMTFTQALGLFVQENHYYPPRTLSYMPILHRDWLRKVSAVPRGRLTGARPDAF